ncbi:hypothetical protein [Microbacterium sp. SLBN-154]|uniref:hypothetical protein n=1 Tax=Microbacterium sp. SLBN-154 TaxID=2768458 RepID=UPI0011520BAD|nr:hypothetical protein [Microbacterium sp. SLBN-154]
MTRLNGWKLGRPLAILTAASLAMGLLFASPAVAMDDAQEASHAAGTRIVPAADLSQFRPGNIISDDRFFDSSTMTESQIDAFLRQRVKSCQSGYVCLKDFRQTTTTRAADRYCGEYRGETSETAARIIAKVAQACGLNPQVLIVTLEKEQGLVTHTWPSDWRYTIAMGQGCPDTAACDTRYYGFFNQVYGAARQFQIYTEGRYFTYYAPGKTWNVRYSPNASCGSSPVFIENQATANLYYYTPYQPNAASLRAGYGQGDGCSTYGNRNFYQRFTDWFGSTQAAAATLVTGPARDHAYLVADGRKHPIAAPDDLTAFSAKFGRLRDVSATYLDSLATGQVVSRYVHDSRTGTLYLIDLDGSKHRLTSVEQVAQFGYVFESFANLGARVLDAFPTGAEVGRFFRPSGTTETYVLENNQRRHLADPAAYTYAARGQNSYVATMDAAAAAKIPLGPTYFMPNTLVRGASSGDVLLTTPTGTVVHVPSFALAAEFGAVKYTVVADALLARSTRVADSLGPIVRCGDADLVAADGRLRPVSGDTTGLSRTNLTEAECAAFTRGSAVAAPLFVQAKNGPDVHAVVNGTLRHVRDYAMLTSLNGSRPLTVLRWSADTMAWQGIGGPVLIEGEFVQFAGSGEVYRWSEGSLHHITDLPTLTRLGGGRIPPITTLPAQFKSTYPYGDPISDRPALAESAFVSFSDHPEVFKVADGELRHVADYAALIYLGGDRMPAIQTLSGALWGQYPTGSAITGVPTISDGSFVQFTGAAEVHRYVSGDLRHVTSVNTLVSLGGGRIPPIQQLPVEDRAAFRIGAPLP